MDQSPVSTVDLAPLWVGDRFAEDQALCLDFVNTVSWRGREEPSDNMSSPEAWLAWMEANGAADEASVAELRRRASMWSFEAEAGFKRAVEFRESLYALLMDTIEGKKSVEKSELDDVLARALDRLSLDAGQSPWQWRFAGSPVDWETPLYPIALSAAQLLSSSWIEKLRACERDECRWLFLDVTKNHSRKWCDMGTCGNVMKARRSYARRKKGVSARPDRSVSPLR